jgi:hypothetical protein
VAGQGLVWVRARDERNRVVLEGRGCRLQVGELLDLAEQLVEDGTLNELAKVLPWIRPSWMPKSQRSAD